MTDTAPNRRSRFLARATRAVSTTSSLQPLHSNPSSPYGRRPLRSPSPALSDPFSSQNDHLSTMDGLDSLTPPTVPFRGDEGSRRSSVSSDKYSGMRKTRPSSLSVNYVPAKFTKLHAPGTWAHRRAKQGGGRDAFATDASRMGMMGTVDDDEGVVFQLGKGGLKKKKPRLRWNRFKLVLFFANTVLIAYGTATLVSAILVWLNVFYQADVIRVGNFKELVISTVAASFIVLTSLVGYGGIILNNRAFLAVYTLFLWICLGLMVAPGYMTYKQRTYNLEGKINAQWSRNLGPTGRLRIQDALRCCGYFSPFVEATVSPLCYARSNFPGCKSRYLRLERHILEIWYIVAFSLVPTHILIILASLLCSNHITYRFGKGLTPKQYRLDLGSMAVIMDEYASQIAAQYGPGLAKAAVDRSSLNLANEAGGLRPYSPGSRTNSFTTASASGANPTMTKVTSRLAPGITVATAGSALYDPGRESYDGSSVKNSETEADRGDDSSRWGGSENHE